ncbi:deoxyribonuclease [Gallid alphaherpesvirus 1]|uniref:Deoxyribonuclease n=1 Tax=Infectious laryngotracheitis virus TaxID=10386 RepID=A0A0K0K633_ILTV|nr:deoxyribonuclease [Gallid alphaherpesvirus 1]
MTSVQDQSPLNENMQCQKTLELSVGMQIPKELPGVAMFTFYDYLADLARGGHAQSDILQQEPLHHRLAYISHLFSWLEKEGFAYGILNKFFGSERALSASEISSNLSQQQINEILFFIESETKQQASCDLWKVLRQFLLTASTLKWMKNKPCSKPEWFKVQEFKGGHLGYATQSMPLIFGNTNESCARSLLLGYVTGEAWKTSEDREEFYKFDDGHPPEEAFTCGLLLDKRSGMLGASMDMAIVKRRKQCARKVEIYEIKCRAKYVFSVENQTHPLSQLYDKMLQHPCENSIRDFLLGISSPGVEFVEESGIPTASEALPTCDKTWKTDRWKKNLRERACLMEKRHLSLNRTNNSSVFLFESPCLETNTIRPVQWPDGENNIELPIFINPKHQNFKQIFVQTYVLAEYFETIPISPFLVTFIGRNRKTVERGRVFKLEHTLDGIEEPVELNCKHAIPVLLIITPTTIDRNHFSDLDSLGREAFEFSVKETWAKVSVDTSENVAAPAVQSPAGVTQDPENLESACPY